MLIVGVWFVGGIIWKYVSPTSALEKNLLWTTTGLMFNSLWMLAGLYMLWAGYSGVMAPAPLPTGTVMGGFLKKLFK
jgi:hypothetical protein